MCVRYLGIASLCVYLWRERKTDLCYNISASQVLTGVVRMVGAQMVQSQIGMVENGSVVDGMVTMM